MDLAEDGFEDGTRTPTKKDSGTMPPAPTEKDASTIPPASTEIDAGMIPSVPTWERCQ